MLSVRTSLRLLAVLASVAAGLVHLAVAHGGHADASAAFFVGLGVVQLAWALAWALRPARLLAVAALVVNLGAIALWLWSRAPGGLPVGPDAGQQLPFGRAGVLSAVLELAVVVAVVAATARPVRARSWFAAPVLVLGAVSVAVAGTAGVQAALAHDHGSHDDAAGHDGDHNGGHDGGHGHDDGGQQEPAPTTQTGPAESPSPRPTVTDGHDDGHDHGH